MKTRGSPSNASVKNDVRRNVVNRWVNTTGDVPLTPEQAVVAHERGAVTAACNEIAVECWCGRTRVWVPQSYPKRGRTRACGTSRCHTPLGFPHEVGERVAYGQKGTR